MMTEDILLLETDDPGCIHLVRDRLFWQAWERSAFLFVRLLRPYRVHHRFVKKVGMDLVWLGFPESVLPALQAESAADGWEWNQVTNDHVKITGIPAQQGFEEWKEKIVADFARPEKAEEKNLLEPPVPDVLRAYRLIYDFNLYIFRLSAKFNRDFKFGIGERLRGSLMDLLESAHLSLNHLEHFDASRALCLLERVRVELRLLCDLKQLSEKQWLFMNGKLEEILKLLLSESSRSRTTGACKEKSSDPLSFYGAQKTSAESALS